METEQAKRVRVGDVAIYRRVRHRVVAVHNDGFWAPYFVLEGAGEVAHALVDSVEIQPASGLLRGRRTRPSRGARLGQTSRLPTPELGIRA